MDSILLRLFLLFNGLSGATSPETCGTGGMEPSSGEGKVVDVEDVLADGENNLVKLLDRFKGFSDVIEGFLHAGKGPLIPPADIVPRFSNKEASLST